MEMRRDLHRCVWPIDCEPGQARVDAVLRQGLFFETRGFEPVTRIIARSHFTERAAWRSAGGRPPEPQHGGAR